MADAPPAPIVPETMADDVHSDGAVATTTPSPIQSDAMTDALQSAGSPATTPAPIESDAVSVATPSPIQSDAEIDATPSPIQSDVLTDAIQSAGSAPTTPSSIVSDAVTDAVAPAGPSSATPSPIQSDSSAPPSPIPSEPIADAAALPSLALYDLPDDVLLQIFNDLDATSMRSLMAAGSDNARLRDAAQAHIDHMIGIWSSVFPWFSAGILSAPNNKTCLYARILRHYARIDTTYELELERQLLKRIWPILFDLRDLDVYDSTRNCRQYCARMVRFCAIPFADADMGTFMVAAQKFLYFIAHLLVPEENIPAVEEPKIEFYNAPDSYYIAQYNRKRYLTDIADFRKRTALPMIQALSMPQRKALRDATCMTVLLENTADVTLECSVEKPLRLTQLMLPQFSGLDALSIVDATYDDLIRILKYLKTQQSIKQLIIVGAPYDPSVPATERKEDISTYSVHNVTDLVLIRCHFVDDTMLRWLVRRFKDVHSNHLYVYECSRVTPAGLTEASRQLQIGYSLAQDYDSVLRTRERELKAYLNTYVRKRWRQLPKHNLRRSASYVDENYDDLVTFVQAECGGRMITDGVQEALRLLPECLRKPLPEDALSPDSMWCRRRSFRPAVYAGLQTETALRIRAEYQLALLQEQKWPHAAAEEEPSMWESIMEAVKGPVGRKLFPVYVALWASAAVIIVCYTAFVRYHDWIECWF